MKEKGQGLVEMALILPFLLILAVGLVEAGMALQRQIVVVNAAREGARFGASGATPDDIHEVTLFATSQMLDFSEEDTTIVIIHAEVNGQGDGFEEWSEKAYPEGGSTPHVTPDEVLAELQEHGDVSGIKLVVVDIEYGHQSMLGLPIVGALAGRVPIGSWTVMRIETPPTPHPTCLVYPIAVHESTLEDQEGGGYLGDIYNGSGEGNFGWLRWPQDTNYASAVWLREFLVDPSWSGRIFQDADDPDDAELNIGDSVWGNTGLSNSEDNRQALDELTTGKYIRVVVWDTAEGVGSGAKYHVVGFAIVELTSYDLSGQNRISARFIRWDTHCK